HPGECGPGREAPRAASWRHGAPVRLRGGRGGQIGARKRKGGYRAVVVGCFFPPPARGGGRKSVQLGSTNPLRYAFVPVSLPPETVRAPKSLRMRVNCAESTTLSRELLSVKIASMAARLAPEAFSKMPDWFRLPVAPKLMSLPAAR